MGYLKSVSASRSPGISCQEPRVKTNCSLCLNTAWPLLTRLHRIGAFFWCHLLHCRYRLWSRFYSCFCQSWWSLRLSLACPGGRWMSVVEIWRTGSAATSLFTMMKSSKRVVLCNSQWFQSWFSVKFNSNVVSTLLWLYCSSVTAHWRHPVPCTVTWLKQRSCSLKTDANYRFARWF